MVDVPEFGTLGGPMKKKKPTANPIVLPNTPGEVRVVEDANAQKSRDKEKVLNGLGLDTVLTPLLKKRKDATQPDNLGA